MTYTCCCNLHSVKHAFYKMPQKSKYTVHNRTPLKRGFSLYTTIRDHPRGRWVYSRNYPTFSFFKLMEKWFYIGYIERIFQKTITSLQNYFKWSKLPSVSYLQDYPCIMHVYTCLFSQSESAGWSQCQVSPYKHWMSMKLTMVNGLMVNK